MLYYIQVQIIYDYQLYTLVLSVSREEYIWKMSASLSTAAQSAEAHRLGLSGPSFNTRSSLSLFQRSGAYKLEAWNYTLLT